MHNQHPELSQTLADQHRNELQQQATRQRLLPAAGQPRRRTGSPRPWRQLLTHRPRLRAS